MRSSRAPILPPTAISADALLAGNVVDPQGPAPPPANVAVIDDDAMEAG